MVELLSVISFIMAFGALLGVISSTRKANAGASAIVNAQTVGIKKNIRDHQTAVKEAVAILNKRIDKLEKDYQSARNSQLNAGAALAGLEKTNHNHLSPTSIDVTVDKTGTG